MKESLRLDKNCWFSKARRSTTFFMSIINSNDPTNLQRTILLLQWREKALITITWSETSETIIKLLKDSNLECIFIKEKFSKIVHWNDYLPINKIRLSLNENKWKFRYCSIMTGSDIMKRPFVNLYEDTQLPCKKLKGD